MQAREGQEAFNAILAGGDCGGGGGMRGRAATYGGGGGGGLMQPQPPRKQTLTLGGSGGADSDDDEDDLSLSLKQREWFFPAFVAEAPATSLSDFGRGVKDLPDEVGGAIVRHAVRERLRGCEAREAARL
jgi:hypothetical protein